MTLVTEGMYALRLRRDPARSAPVAKEEPMRRVVAATLLLVLAGEPFAFAVGKDKAMYVGGTIGSMAAKTEGALVTSDEAKMIFIAEKGRGIIEIPYQDVQEIEYGQKAGHKLKEAILLTPIFLFSKRRHHFLTVSYKDKDGKDQAAVFELGKELVRTTLTIVETRTGRKVVYQDEEAAKHRAK